MFYSELSFLLIALLCSLFFSSVALKLNLTASCSNNQIYFCSFAHITATLDDPLVLVNASVPQLNTLIIRNSLITRVPSELFLYAPNVSTFFMHRCGVNRVEPYDFRLAHSLRKLALQHNRLSELPEKVFGSAFALEQLLLAHNTLHMVHGSAFVGLTQLRYLDLQVNSLRRLPASVFRDLSRLEHLDLSSNELETIDAQTFASLGALKTLLLADNKFAVFEPNSLEHLSHLHFLDLSSCSLDELNLQSVDTLMVQNSGLKRCVIAGSAIKVHAGNNQLTGLSIGDKLAVRELDLHSNLLESLEDFVDMQNLQRLDVSRNRLQTLSTSRSPLYVPLPGLLHLNLAFNQLQNLNQEQFVLLQKLTYLDLAFNRLQQLNASVFDALSMLEKLYIEGNRLQTFNYMKFLEQHKALKEFGIFANEWEFHYMRKMINYLQEETIQLPSRFSSSTTTTNPQLNTTTHHATSTTPHAHNTKHPIFISHHEDGFTEAMNLEHDPNGVAGIHPYWTTRDILALITLLFVLLVLVLQFFNILREEQCFQRCWRRGRGDAGERRRLNDEEDSEV